MQPKHFRIFMASPGDVPHEREIAFKVIDQLAYESFPGGRITIDPIAWDKAGAGTPILANITPQESIRRGLPKPSECDIVVIIFWERMGTPLPAEYTKKDGSRYLSGTEWEYEDAIQAGEQNGSPKVLLYWRTERQEITQDDPQFDEKRRQYLLVKDFFAAFVNEDGSIKRGYNTYQTPGDFKELLEHNLKSLIEQLLKEPQFPDFQRKNKHALPPVWSASPFPGLRAFTPEDEPIFFGRERETDALVKRVEENKFVAVVGASGSGKSSLVGAGLIPRLRLTTSNEGWFAVTSTPDYLGTNNPFASLAASLLRDLQGLKAPRLADLLHKDQNALPEVCAKALNDKPEGARLILFIDQFEELFTTVTPNLREPFIEILETAAASKHIHVVVTLRGDFYGKCVEIPKLAKLLEESTYPLPVPGIAALYEMITRPAARADLEFEGGLAQRILDDTGDEPGSLALMAYTLDELYRLSGTDKILTHRAYETLGGVQGAIGKRSESVFSKLSRNEQNALPHVFRELVEVDERGTATRQRSTLSQVAKTGEALNLANALTDARLLVQNRGEKNDPFVEVAHEALLRNWERLAEWIKDTQDDLRLLRQVRIAAQEWERNERRDDFLWSQERLEPVYAMRERLQVEFEPVVEDFTRPEIDRLLDEYKSHTQYFKQKAVTDRLVEIGLSSLPALIKALPFAVTRSAKKNLYEIFLKFHKRAIPLLIDYCQTEDKELRKKVIETLGKLGDAAAVKKLIQLLEDANSEIRVYALAALGNIGDSSALQPVINKISDKDIQISKIAIISSTGFNDAKILSVLTQTLSHKDVEIRRASVFIIGLLGRKQSSREYYYYYRYSQFSELFSSSLEKYKEIKDFLLQIVNRAAGKLHKYISSLEVEALIKSLSDKDKIVRISAAGALGEIGRPSALSALLEALDDKDVDVRKAAFSALEKIVDKSTVKLLVGLLTDNYAEFHSRIIGILGNLGETSVTPLLIKALSDINRDVRSAAVIAIGELGDKSAAPALRQLLQDFREHERELIREAIKSLSELDDIDSIPLIINVLNNSKDTFYERRIIDALKKFHTSEARSAVRRWQENN